MANYTKEKGYLERIADALENGGGGITPTGKITITENGTDIDVSQYALADVNVSGGGGLTPFDVTITAADNGSLIVMDLVDYNDSNLVFGLVIDNGTYHSSGYVPVGAGETKTFSFLLLDTEKGILLEADDQSTYDIDGDASIYYDEQWSMNMIKILGPCTITISRFE